MSNLPDLWKAYLIGQGYTFKSIEQGLVKALQAETTLTTNTLADLWAAYMAAEGYTDGALQQRIYAWLGAKGYTQKGIDERWKAALLADDVFITPSLTLLYDSFTDTPGTAITSHTPDTVNSPASGSWAQDVGTFAIDSTTGTTVVRTSASTNDTHIYFESGISDGIVAVSALTQSVGLEFRRSDQSNLWMLYHSPTSAGKDWVLYERVAGTYTSRGSYLESIGTSYKAAVVFNGAQIDCYINGTLRISYASAASGLSSTKVGFDREITSPPALVSTDIYVINSTDPADIPV